MIREIDWTQVLLNLMSGQESGRDGQPCFHVEDDRFCLRAKFWDGHEDQHRFVSLLAALGSEGPAEQLRRLTEPPEGLEFLALGGPVTPPARWKVELLSGKGNWSDAVSPQFDTWDEAQQRAGEMSEKSKLGVKFRVVRIAALAAPPVTAPTATSSSNDDNTKEAT
jgi:hypothetical protein